MIVVIFVISLLILSLISYGVYYLCYKLLEVNFSHIKYSKKLSQKALNNISIPDELLKNIKGKITYNFPCIKSQKEYDKIRQDIAPLGVNFEYQFFVISLNDRDNPCDYIKDICAIKQLETLGTYVNLIIITSQSQKRVYNLKYTLANLDFRQDVVRLFVPDDLSTMQTNMLNKLNINRTFGSQYSQNSSKMTDYCIKTRVGSPFVEQLRSTMQTEPKDIFTKKYFASEESVDRSECFNYMDEMLITRFDFSKAGRDCSICKFVPFFNLKYFDIKLTPYEVVIEDFEQKTKLYLCSNLPIFSGAKYSKCGLYFWHKMITNFLYIITSKKPLDDHSLFSCEGALIKAKSLIKSLPKVNVQSGSQEVDHLVNKVLPEQIIKEYLKNPFDKTNAFCQFAMLDITRTKAQTEGKLQTLITKYFDTLKKYYGIGFGSSGLYLTTQKDNLLSSVLTFKKGSNTYTMQIKNSGLESGTFKFREIEYTGINYITYDKLSSSLVLQM